MRYFFSNLIQQFLNKKMELEFFLKHHFLFAYRYIHDSRKILLQVNQITSFIIFCTALFQQINVVVLKKENF